MNHKDFIKTKSYVDVLYWLYNVCWLIQVRVRCFFAGHDERPGLKENYESDYCARCYCEWPQDKVTLPVLLHRVHWWLVERDWMWFERIEKWLLDNSPWLPKWWEY